MANKTASKGRPGFGGKVKGSENKQQGPAKKSKPSAGPGGLGPSSGGISGGPPPELLAAMGQSGGGVMGEGGPMPTPMGGPPPRKKGRAP